MENKLDDPRLQSCPAQNNESSHHWVPVRIQGSKTYEQEMRCRYCKIKMSESTK